MIDNLKYTLQKIELVKTKYDILRQREEQFNIFSVLYKNHEEKRLHSRFIANLLDPFASHGKGNTFLFIFLKLLQDEIVKENHFQNAIVYPEEWNKKENANIDILIIDRSSKHAIIIENKIYAGDSNNEKGGQLERYFNHILQIENIPKTQIRTYYLTLDGHLPSSESLGDYKILENINGKCLAYEQIIIDWLNLCLPMAVEKPFLRESILQYKKLIQKMTHDDTEIKERIRIKETIGTNEQTLRATKYLLDNFDHVKWHTLHDFWVELEKELTDKFHFSVKSCLEGITHIAHYNYNKAEESCGLYFENNNGYKAFIWHEKDSFLYWGVEKENLSEKYSEKLKILKDQSQIQEATTYWWKDFEFENGEKLFIKDFSLDNTFNLINPEIRINTVTQIVTQVSTFLFDTLGEE